MFNKILIILLLFITNILYSQDIWVGYKAYDNIKEYNVFRYYTNMDSVTAEVYSNHLQVMMDNNIDYEEITQDLLVLASYIGLVYYVYHIYDVSYTKMLDLKSVDEKVRYVEATMERYHYTRELYNHNEKFKY